MGKSLFEIDVLSWATSLGRTLADTEVQRELLLVAMCLVLALLLRHFVMGLLPPASEGEGERSARRIGRAGLRRLLFPLIGLGLVVVARALLHRHQDAPILDLAIPLLLSMAAIRLFAFILHQAFGHTLRTARFEQGSAMLAWCVVALHILGWLPDLIDGLKALSFNLGQQKLSLWILLQGAALVLVALLAALWAGGAVERRLMRAEEIDDNVRLVLARLVKTGLVVVAVLVALPAVGIDLTTLSVFGGAIGVGLGFGLQKIAANYVSGFIILMDRSLRIGNMISVGSERGVVSQITTRYTVIRAPNGIESIIPNETLVSSVVQNETFSDTKVLLPVDVQVAYGSNLERALQILEELARAHPRVLADPAPRGLVLEFADSGINLRLGCWVDRPQEGRALVRSELNLAIWRRFSSEGIEIPFPQREIRLLPAPAVDVAHPVAVPEA